METTEKNKSSRQTPFDIIDAHAHFFPEKMFHAVWKFFENGNWSINYKGTPEGLAETLAGFGVSHFTVLNYLHKPGMRDPLAAWTKEFCERIPGALPFGTLFPDDPGNLEAARTWFSEWGFLGLKIQPLVSARPIDAPSMIPVFELMADLGKLLIVHAGSAPYPNEFTSLDALESVLKRVPNLKTVLAHMGGFEYSRALDMLDSFPNLYLDTTMIFVNTKVFNASYPIPMERLEPYLDRIIFGSDFPNIPYEYSESTEGLKRYGFDDATLKKIMRDNSKRILGIS